MDSANSPPGRAQGGTYDPSDSPPLAPTPSHPQRILNPPNATPSQYPRRTTTLVRIDSDIAEVVYDSGTPNTRSTRRNPNLQRAVVHADRRSRPLAKSVAVRHPQKMQPFPGAGATDGDHANASNEASSDNDMVGAFVRALLECVNNPAIDSINWNNDGTCMVITDGEIAAQEVRTAYHGSFNFKSKPTWTKLRVQLRSHSFQRVEKSVVRSGFPATFKHACFKRDVPQLYRFVRTEKHRQTATATATAPVRTASIPRFGQAPPPLFVQALLRSVNDSAVKSINWDQQGTHVVITNANNAAQAVRKAYQGSYTFTTQPTWDKLVAQFLCYHFHRVGEATIPRPGLPVKFKHSCFKRSSPQLYNSVRTKKPRPSAPRIPASTKPSLVQRPPPSSKTKQPNVQTELNPWVHALSKVLDDSRFHDTIAWSPDGKRVIAFSKAASRYVINSLPKQLRKSTAWDFFLQRLDQLDFTIPSEPTTFPAEFHHPDFCRDNQKSWSKIAPQASSLSIVRSRARSQRTRSQRTRSQTPIPTPTISTRLRPLPPVATKSRGRRGTKLPQPISNISDTNELPVTTRLSRGTIRTRPTHSVPAKSMETMGHDEMDSNPVDHDHDDDDSDNIQHVPNKPRRNGPLTNTPAPAPDQQLVQLASTTSTLHQDQLSPSQQYQPYQQPQPYPHQNLHHHPLHQEQHHQQQQQYQQQHQQQLQQQQQHQQCSHCLQIAHNLTQTAQTFQTFSKSFDKSASVFQRSADASSQDSLLFPIISANLTQSAAMLQHFGPTLLKEAQKLTNLSQNSPTMHNTLSQAQMMDSQNQQQQNHPDLTEVASNITSIVQTLGSLGRVLSTSQSMLRVPDNHQPQTSGTGQGESNNTPQQLLLFNLSSSITMLQLAHSSLSQELQLLTTHHHDTAD